jgi:predicted SAM-dependent methyltransferase
MNWLNKLRKYRWAVTGRKKIKTLVKQKQSKNESIKIILGSSNHTAESGEWINTDIPQFDITNPSHWEYIFSDIKIDNLLAEHVLEHLTREQILTTLKLARKFLKESGVFRIAIPDKNNPDPTYRDATRPGGNGPGADDHKVFLSHNDFIELAQKTSFKLLPLEYFDSEHKFHFTEYGIENGIVQRSKQQNYTYDKYPAYTSLVIDLVAC